MKKVRNNKKIPPPPKKKEKKEKKTFSAFPAAAPLTENNQGVIIN